MFMLRGARQSEIRSHAGTRFGIFLTDLGMPRLVSSHQDGARSLAPPRMQPAAEGQPTSLAQLDPDVLYSPEELAEPAAALVAQMSLEEDASLR